MNKDYWIYPCSSRRTHSGTFLGGGDASLSTRAHLLNFYPVESPFSLTHLHPPAIICPLKVRNQTDGPLRDVPV